MKARLIAPQVILHKMKDKQPRKRSKTHRSTSEKGSLQVDQMGRVYRKTKPQNRLVCYIKES